jgi:hypothetical protein
MNATTNTGRSSTTTTTSMTAPIATPSETAATTTTTIMKMKEYLEQTIHTQYRGEALVQRFVHIITTLIPSILLKITTTQTTSTVSIASPNENDSDTWLMTMMIQTFQTACQMYLGLVNETNNTYRYNELYQIITTMLIHPLSSLSSSAVSLEAIIPSSVLPPYDAAVVHHMEQLTLALQQHQSTSSSTSSLSSTSTAALPTLHVLHQRLQMAQSHLNKDAIRMAYMQLALYYTFSYYQHSDEQHHHNNPSSSSTSTPQAVLSIFQQQQPPPQQQQYGHLYRHNTYYHDAIQMSLRSLEFCGTKYHTTTHTILILVIALYQQHYIFIADYIRRIQHNLIIPKTSGASATNTTTSSTTAMSMNNGMDHATIRLWQEKVNTISALERLHNGDYVMAASKFRAIALQISNRTATTTPNSSSSSSNTTTTTTAATTATTKTNMTTVTTIEDLINEDNWDQLVLSPEDVVLYATVLTLAVNLEASNNQTKNHRNTTTTATVAADVNNNRTIGLQFMDHPNMKSLFERTPILYEILKAYYQRSDYKMAYELLEQYIYPIVQFDLYLAQPTMSSSILMNPNSHASVTPVTHLHAIRSMIRTKCIVMQWKAYVECPLVTMMESLGRGIAMDHTPGLCGSRNSSSGNSAVSNSSHSNDDQWVNPENVTKFESYIIQLLKERFRPDRGSNNRGNTIMLFPMDTRYDCVHQKLIRCHTPYTKNVNGTGIDVTTAVEQAQLYDTTVQYYRTSQRILDDTYSMLVRIPCIEYGIEIPASSGFGNTTKTSSRPRGGRMGYVPPQQQHQPFTSTEWDHATSNVPDNNLRDGQQLEHGNYRHNVDTVYDDNYEDPGKMMMNMIPNESDDFDGGDNDDDDDVEMVHDSAMNPEDMY